MRNLETAQRLLAEPAADLHFDLPGELLLRRQRGEREVIKKRYLPRWKKAGIGLIGAAVYVEDSCLPEGGLRNALLQIQALKEELAESEGGAVLVTDREGLRKADKGEYVGIILSMEGLECIGTDAELVHIFWELGVRGASLVWSRRCVLARGCSKVSQWETYRGGITEAGWRVIETMRKLHMFLDISHLNDDGIDDALAAGDIPILATHSNARALYAHDRNLTDMQLERLADRGGLVGLNAYGPLTGPDGGSLERLCEHAFYLCGCAGASHVCLGLDLCRPYELARRELDENDRFGQELLKGYDVLRGHEDVPLLAAALLQLGMEEEGVRALCGRNAFAFMEKALPQRRYDNEAEAEPLWQQDI